MCTVATGPSYFNWCPDATDEDVCILPLITVNDSGVIAPEAAFDGAEFLPSTAHEELLLYGADFVLFEQGDEKDDVGKQPPGETHPSNRSVLCKTVVARDHPSGNASTISAPLSCAVCTLRFECKTQLTRHHSLWHDNVPSDWKPIRSRNRCRLCRDQFSSVRQLATHLTQLHPQCAVCDLCVTTFHDQATLEWHRNRHLAEGTSPDCLQRTRYVCDSCQKQCTSSSHLHLHRKIHLDRKPYPCSYPGCGLSFSSSGNRRKHIVRMHTHERKHTCLVCAESFIYPRQLLLHQRRQHTENGPSPPGDLSGDRRFECTTCGRCFKQRTHLRNHLLLHSGSERAHGCEFCAKRFTLVGDLRIHRRIHTQEKPFRCGLCPAAFRMGRQLKSHRTSVHVQTVLKPDLSPEPGDLQSPGPEGSEILHRSSLQMFQRTRT